MQAYVSKACDWLVNRLFGAWYRTAVLERLGIGWLICLWLFGGLLNEAGLPGATIPWFALIIGVFLLWTFFGLTAWLRGIDPDQRDMEILWFMCAVDPEVGVGYILPSYHPARKWAHIGVIFTFVLYFGFCVMRIAGVIIPYLPPEVDVAILCFGIPLLGCYLGYRLRYEDFFNINILAIIEGNLAPTKEEPNTPAQSK